MVEFIVIAAIIILLIFGPAVYVWCMTQNDDPNYPPED